MDDRTLANVFCRPGVYDHDPAKPYWPVGRLSSEDPPTKGLSWREVFYRPERIKAMKTLGMSDADIEAKYNEWIKSYQGVQQSGG